MLMSSRNYRQLAWYISNQCSTLGTVLSAEKLYWTFYHTFQSLYLKVSSEFYWNLEIDKLTYAELFDSIFQQLEDAVLSDDTVESQLALLTFYNNLLDQWATTLLPQSQPSPIATPAIISLVNHANSLTLTIIQNSQSVSTLSTVLNFYESTASLISSSLWPILHNWIKNHTQKTTSTASTVSSWTSATASGEHMPSIPQTQMHLAAYYQAPWRRFWPSMSRVSTAHFLCHLYLGFRYLLYSVSWQFRMSGN